jgi:ATP-dependent DNA helicase RecG
MSEYEVFGYVSGRGQPQHDAEVVPDATLDRDIPEYPLDAVREVIANAVAHRDYSPYVRGSYIQIRLFADRIEVQSPGGLFGNVNIENLEEQHSTRNARLMRILEDLHVVENRGSGIGSMLRALREANLEPPRFDDRRSSFWVTIRNHTLMNPTAIAWLNQFADRTINDRQRLALVYFRQRGQIANADYRRLNHVDSTVAGQELRGLVQQGLVAQDGVGRGTTYRLLAVDDANASTAGDSSPEIAVLSLVQSRGAVTSGDCQALLGLNKDQTYRLLSKLSQDGRLKAVGHGRWRRYTAP